MKRKIAAIGDIHGCIDELETLVKKLEWLSLDEIWSLGDVCDRGPDSGACYQLLREKRIPMIMGNHDENLLKHWKRMQAGGDAPGNPDKARSISQMSPEDFEYIAKAPFVKEFHDLKLGLVHGGVWPGLELNRQPHNVIRAQLVRYGDHGKTRWWGKDATKHKEGMSEEQSRYDGYFRWYEIWDGEATICYGHSVWNQPLLHKPANGGLTVGVDLGSCFGGSLAAAIFDGSDPWFVSVKCKKVYYENSTRIHQEE